MAPELRAVLPLIETRFRTMFEPACVWIEPPVFARPPPTPLPCTRIMFLICSVPEVTRKCRLVPEPERNTTLTPSMSPSISSVLSITISLPPSVNVSPIRFELKTIVSPFNATSTASRSEQSALHTPSLLLVDFVTVNVAACTAAAEPSRIRVNSPMKIAFTFRFFIVFLRK